jgi:hypothetical protein
MSCLVCGSSEVAAHIDVGEHPVASFFLEDVHQSEKPYSLVLGQCPGCGTVQLMQPVPHHALVPPYDWLLAREPEEHLDDAVARIIGEGILSPQSVIGGLTYKDDTTVERFRNLGFPSTWRLDLKNDFELTDPAANIETVQKLVSPERMAGIARNHPPADLLIVRHITEHTEDLSAFMAGLAELVAPDGQLMLEIPDCSSSLELGEYCMIWEEHSLYFTPETFALVPALGGFSTLWLKIYERPFENSLVLLARKGGPPARPVVSEAARSQIGLLESYGSGYAIARRTLRDDLEKFRREQGPIALFGAGHLAHAFANFMGVSDLIDFVADDTPQKQGKYLSGAKLPILPSSELLTRNIKLCLLALSIPSEPAVIERNASFVSSGGTFRSILRASPRSIFSNPLPSKVVSGVP